MLIYLTREEILNAVVEKLQATIGVSTSDAALGFINGEATVVVGVNEKLPEDLFEEDDHQDTDNDQPENQSTDKPAKRGQRRKRRTRAEIEADEAAEAAAKQAAEAQQPQQASGEAAGESQDAKQPEAETQKTEEILEAQAESDADQTKAVEEPVKEAAVAEDNPFADLGSDNGSVETDPEPQVGTNPFPTEDADNLFETGSDQVHVDSPVETEQGFAKPKEDDDALNLFA